MKGHTQDRPYGTEETTMNALNATVKSVVCGAAAMAATLVMSWSVVHSTATYPWASEVSVAHPVAVTRVALQPRHQWLGQPAPAVLVD